MVYHTRGERSWDELFHCWFAGWLTGAACMIVAVLLMSCVSSRPPIDKCPEKLTGHP